MNHRQIDAEAIAQGRPDVGGGAIGIDRQQQDPIDPSGATLLRSTPALPKTKPSRCRVDDQAGAQPDHFQRFRIG